MEHGREKPGHPWAPSTERDIIMGYDRNDAFMTCGERDDRCAILGLDPRGLQADEGEVMSVVYVVILLVALVLLWPAKYDPAIRFREWLDRKKP